MGPLLLPLLDSKTIRIEPPDDPVPANLGIEMMVAVGLLALVLAALFLVPRFWRLLRPEARLVDENWVLIDGSNVMHWQDNTPSLETVRKVVDQVRSLGYVPGVVFDANAGWKLSGRYLHDQDFARLLGIEPRQVLVVAKGTQADPFLLQTAREFGARIVTNDRFRDWSEAHPEVQTPGFLIRGGAVEGTIRLKGLNPRPGKPG
jgi:sigma54-dependent transcription regulator